MKGNVRGSTENIAFHFNSIYGTAKNEKQTVNVDMQCTRLTPEIEAYHAKSHLLQ